METTCRTQLPELEPNGGAFRPVLFYALAVAVAWFAWTPLVLHKLEVWRLPLPFPLVLFVGQTLGAFAPVLALFAIQRISKDATLVRRVFSRLRYKGISIYWFLVPALTPIGITMGINIQYSLITGSEIAVFRPEPVEQLGWGLLAVIPFQFVMGMIGSPLGEEPGWRGYILDGFFRKRTGHCRVGYCGSSLVDLAFAVVCCPRSESERLHVCFDGESFVLDR